MPFSRIQWLNMIRKYTGLIPFSCLAFVGYYLAVFHNKVLGSILQIGNKKERRELRKAVDHTADAAITFGIAGILIQVIEPN